ncbi:hypothetical protein PIB30_089824 [Stylosanthes scabra]|uniref:Uncharacterized protein n=1 Tax=Stylosanthes scabra TaxID=79078 RepID=A0ABU6ZSR0_9FABA|nr:hypothetical protein [Stylosanthes scabra]
MLALMRYWRRTRCTKASASVQNVTQDSGEATALLSQAEAIGATWLLGFWYLSVSGLLKKWFEVRGCLAPEFPRRNRGRAPPEEWTGGAGRAT